MATKLEAFLAEKKIDQRRLLATSARIEQFQPEDRAIKLVQRQARRSEDRKKPEGLAKPRSGRPVTRVALDNVFAGKKISGPTKTRILRAINHLLAQKKEEAATLSDLFAS